MSLHDGSRLGRVIPRAPAVRAAWAAFLVTLPVYLATMSRTVGFVDRGELAAVAVTFGIPHATGYPTLMLAAGTLTRVVPLRPVLVLNALAAILAAAGVAVLTLLFDRLLAAIGGPGLAPRSRAALAALAALFVGFTMTWWQQANGFEVYALHALLMPLVVLTFLRWCDAAAMDPPGARSAETRRAGWAFGLVVGLSLTNHLTTVLLGPALVIVTILRFGLGTALWRRLLPIAPAFLVGLLPYAWLPFRSRMEPRFDWGNPETLGAFLHHVTGADYRGWMFTQPSAMALQTRYLSWRIPSDFLWAGLLVAALGLALIFRRQRPLAILAVCVVGAGWLFATGYCIPDLDAYLLTTVLGVGLCFATGLMRVHERFGARPALVLGALLVAMNAACHWKECDERGNRLVESFVTDLIGPLPANAVLLTDMWDMAGAGSFYFQEVEGFRRDVTVVCPDLVRADWYLEELERREPVLASRSQPALGAYRDALRSIDRADPGSISAAEADRHAFLDALVAGAARDRPVFSTGPIREARPDWHRVPWHLALWLRPDSSYVAEPAWRQAFRPYRGRVDPYAARTCQAYAEARVERAGYERRHGRLDQAETLLDAARAFDPGIDPRRVGPLPLGTDHRVLATARFFRDLGAPGPISAR